MGIVLASPEGLFLFDSSLPLGDISPLKMTILLSGFSKKDRPLSFEFPIVIQNLGRIVRAERND